jgi:predicted transcriptional regulator
MNHTEDILTIKQDIDPLLGFFHTVNRIIPVDQKLLSISPSMKAHTAVQLLNQNKYSQVPVIDNNRVLGMFSYRSFSKFSAKKTYAEITQDKVAPMDILVEDCMEQFQYRHFNSEIDQIVECLNEDNGVLIGAEDNLKSILTPMDLLRYLLEITRPFMLINEMELGVRALIHRVASHEQIVELSKKCLGSFYKDRENKIPQTLEEMTFDNYKTIISNKDNWKIFESTFGGTRQAFMTKFTRVAELRNDIFHNKKPMTLSDYEDLVDHRDWLLVRAKIVSFTIQSQEST